MEIARAASDTVIPNDAASDTVTLNEHRTFRFSKVTIANPVFLPHLRKRLQMLLIDGSQLEVR